LNIVLARRLRQWRHCLRRSTQMRVMVGRASRAPTLTARLRSTARHCRSSASSSYNPIASSSRVSDATEVAVANNLAQAHASAGALDLALPLAESALQRAAQLGDRHRQAALHNDLADLLQALGRHDDARTHVTRAVELFVNVGRSDLPEPEVWKLAEW
jgi:Flp pilus assembly protein TadD